MANWEIWMDTGGTFTDCIAIDPQGQSKRLKVLSSGVLRGQLIKQLSKESFQVEMIWPLTCDIFTGFQLTFVSSNTRVKIKAINFAKNIIYTETPVLRRISITTIEISTGEEVPVFAARLLTETSLKKLFPKIMLKLGSTRGTNALLERKGANTLFITTKGFKDLLVIGTQQRPDLFALKIEKEPPLYSAVVEVNERIAIDGSVLIKLTKEEIKKLTRTVKRLQPDSIAIAFINSYRNPVHENQLEKVLTKMGYRFISVSHRLSNQIKILSRAETTVVNAYLAPIINTYLNNIERGMKNIDLRVMNSAGSLCGARQFFPKDSLLSGPAGGVVGAATTAKKSGANKLITFDMGGTSTDVSLYHQGYDYRFEASVGNTKILSPSLAIETIAAGGGSICDFDGHRLTVGPHSAGASPGPACYGAGGPLTITDVNLLLGRLSPEFFALPIHPNLAKRALEKLLSKISKSGKKVSTISTLESLIQIANEKMAEAIRRVSVQQGYNPSDYSLLSFGGAGGQHACALAEILNMKQIIVPYDAGLLSAYGIGHARVERFEELQILKPLKQVESALAETVNELFFHCLKKLKVEGYSQETIKLYQQLIFLRFRGQESTIEVSFKNPSTIQKLFRKKYESIYGHWITDREIEVESIKVLLCVESNSKSKRKKTSKLYKPSNAKKLTYWINGKSQAVTIHTWENLKSGAAIKGPAMICSLNSTTFVDAGWFFLLDEHNNALINSNSSARRTKKKFSEEASLELFNNRFTSIAQSMGAMLQRTSFSVNVKERLDFSCAVLDANGYLIVNAPHIPVHLGSMGVCVRSVIKTLSLQAGDVAITNHPAYGGSHLPDVTLIKPVFHNARLIGFVSNRAHHAEIGGKKPGSMPVDATTLEEEGVIISPTYLVRGGKACWKNIEQLFLSAKYPSRSVQENLADLNGALASVNLGEQSLQELCSKYGSMEVSWYMNQLKEYASFLMSSKLNGVKRKKFWAEEVLDDGSKLKASLLIRSSKLTIDFSGSSNVHARNLNATNAIVQSVVLYVLRLWVNKPIAMNEGLMGPVKIILPKGLLNPFSDFKAGDKSSSLPAVVGGNTEISQRLTDTLLKALELIACSQGTMNNLLFGNEHLGFYETIGGGTGAGEGFDGVDAIHSHMTNTRITDPEILELRYPVQLQKMEVRKNSGGTGKWKGGNGITREILFKKKMEVNILSQHRIEKPYGLNGGGSGKRGEQFHVSAIGQTVKLKGMDGLTVTEGDSIVIKTPGGGGWGK
jgi:5-oxoprolinase (ATP-hydrolysing)